MTSIGGLTFWPKCPEEYGEINWNGLGRAVYVAVRSRQGWQLAAHQH